MAPSSATCPSYLTAGHPPRPWHRYIRSTDARTREWAIGDKLAAGLVVVVLVWAGVAWGRRHGDARLLRAGGRGPTTTARPSGDWAQPLSRTPGGGGLGVPETTLAAGPGLPATTVPPPPSPPLGGSASPPIQAAPGGPTAATATSAPGPAPPAPSTAAGPGTTTRSQPAPTSAAPPATAPPASATTTTAPPAPTEQLPPDVIELVCALARLGGVTPLPRGNPAYSPAIDPDGNGLACE